MASTWAAVALAAVNMAQVVALAWIASQQRLSSIERTRRAAMDTGDAEPATAAERSASIE